MWNKLKNLLLGALAVVSAWLGFNIWAADVNVSGAPPTTYSDGSPLTDLTAIKLYKVVATGTSPDCAAPALAYSLLATIPHTNVNTRFTYLDANVLSTGRHCYKASAVRANGIESVFSAPAFKDVDVRTPGAPTDLTVN
jgi:hypothetical protein